MVVETPDVEAILSALSKAEQDSKRLDAAQTLFVGADFAWGDPEHPRPVVVLQIPEHCRVGANFRAFLDAAMSKERG